MGCADSTSTSASQYIAVIDAGSSGSRVHLYEASERRVSEVALDRSESDIPLASFADTPNMAGPEVIEPLLAELENAADQSNISPEEITVNVMGTAGMRKVEPEAAADIYKSARDSIRAAGFVAGTTETITGDDEALYAWTDTNDLVGTFTDSSQKPVGIVEVGGASAQIAFAVGESASTSSLTTLTINGTRYDVFTYSYLGMGQNDARKSMLTNESVRTSCYPNSGDTAEVVSPSDDVSFAASQASFDFAVCSALYDEVIAETTKSLPFSEIVTLPGFESTTFYGLSSISFAAADFDVAPKNVLSQLDDTVSAACSGPGAVGTVRELFPPDNQDFAENACANGTYIATLLDQLAIANDRFIGESNINGESPAWPRGFAVLSVWGQID
jgi:hypothetical protein